MASATETNRAAYGSAYPDDHKDAKQDNFASVEEALAGAGTDVLSHLESRAVRPTVEQLEEDAKAPRAPGEHRAYAGPYHSLDDSRNTWTAYQDVSGYPKTRELIEEPDPSTPAPRPA